jgi:hypothetical protein
LKSELTGIKSALDGIHNYTEYNLEEDQSQNLAEGLTATLDGCKLAMDVLAEDVASWLGQADLEGCQVSRFPSYQRGILLAVNVKPLSLTYTI